MVGIVWRAAAAAVVLASWSAISVAADPLKAARELYNQKQYQRALEQLEAARREKPNDPDAALLLGLTLIHLDMPAEAAAAWADYERLAKDRTTADEIARFRTILLREANARAATRAVDDEKLFTAPTPDPSAVAVGTFRGLGSAETAPLGKAISAMLIADLSAIPSLKVLERERVEVLAQEAKLGGSGLVDKRTAVRAGKLLRSGRVVAGSYVDWTASPAHLRVEWTVVKTDTGAPAGGASAEGMLAEFYVVVAKTAAGVAGALGSPVEQLPGDVAAQVQKEHTRSLPAVLAFGRGLALKDRGDYAGARTEFETALKEDPNFELPRRELALLPATLISLIAVAGSVEAAAPAALATGGGLTLTSPAVLAAGGVVAAGAIGGGIAAAAGGGGGGGGARATTTANRHAPTLSGVENRSITLGQTVELQIVGTDPDGTRVHLSSPNLPAGATFTPTDAAPATASFSWTPTATGTTTVTFVATDSGTPRRSTSASAAISVGTPSATTTTTIPCTPLGAGCTQNGACCSGDCAVTPNQQTTVCCTGLGKACTTAGLCCGTTATCTTGVCCLLAAQPCRQQSDCCVGTSCTGGACCLPVNATCTTNAECCTGFCDVELGCQPGSGPIPTAR